MYNLLDQIKSHINTIHFARAKEYTSKDIRLLIKDKHSNLIGYSFNVKRKDSSISDTSVVKLTFYNNNIRSIYCNCYTFKCMQSCEHIPAVIMNYAEFNVENNIQDLSKHILEEFSAKKNNNIKTKLKVEYQLDVYNLKMYDYYGLSVYLKLKVGYDKLYILTASKLKKFMRVYESEMGPIELGKFFTYDPNLYYFTDEDKNVLDFVFNYGSVHYDSIYLSDNILTKLLNLLKDRDFSIKDVGAIHGIKEGIPFPISLDKKDNIYKLNIKYDNIEPLTENYEYIVYNKEVYHINKDYQRLLETLRSYNIKELEFNKEDIPAFNKGILPIIKNNLQIASDMEEIKLYMNPTAKLYFDIEEDNIVCDINLVYGNKETNYFDLSNEELRDIEYENNIINDLNNYGFINSNKQFLLLDLDRIVNFLENDINDLSNKYEVYTSEKLKNTNIRKKININSNFSIGQDNIMHYTFNMNDVSDDEMDDLIKSLRKKKKYHKLKNGDIIALEDNNIEEITNLLDDLNIDDNKASGIIPKYQAIYLDYLKKEKYPHIKTDNKFNDFIKNFNEYKNVKIDFSEDEKSILRPYQIEGVEWLYNIHKCDFGGILADEMGLGKTIQTIYFLRKLKKEDSQSKFLVVCPTALVYNWLKEFETFGQDFQVAILSGYKLLRKQILEKMSADVYITSYGTLREDIDLYDNIVFKVCTLDEAQNIKNPFAKITRAVKKIKADTKIALTGTPLENALVEIWSIFDFIMPGYLNNISKFNEKFAFKDQDDTSKEKISKLKILTSPFILRRKKKDVVKELPEKYENVIYVDLDEEQKKIYALEVKKVKEEIDGLLKGSSFREKRFQILSLLTRLRQICIDPKLIYENYQGTSTKIETLVKTIVENVANEHKILMFTTFKSILPTIKKALDSKKITYYTIDGDVNGKTRQMLVDNFNQDDTNVFLITLKSGGTGLNLTSADIVIHLDLWWNPQVENQATDRAHRIGQTKSVEVIKLIASGTIEERILELQQKKKALADELIEKGSAGNIALSSLSEEDIKNLIDFK